MTTYTELRACVQEQAGPACVLMHARMWRCPSVYLPHRLVRWLKKLCVCCVRARICSLVVVVVPRCQLLACFPVVLGGSSLRPPSRVS